MVSALLALAVALLAVRLRRVELLLRERTPQPPQAPPPGSLPPPRPSGPAWSGEERRRQEAKTPQVTGGGAEEGRSLSSVRHRPLGLGAIVGGVA